MQNHKNWTKEIAMVGKIISKMPLEKTVKWGAEVFTYNGKNVVSYGGFKNHFTIWFYNGVFLEDKYQVLVNAQEGKTKSLRQWRFTSEKEIDEKKIWEYINEAIEIENKGLKIKPEKFKPVSLPKFLSDRFNADKEFKEYFEKLTPGRQKEYMLYIEEAKQEATKIKRFEKIKPMILEGIGLNDKYK